MRILYWLKFILVSTRSCLILFYLAFGEMWNLLSLVIASHDFYSRFFVKFCSLLLSCIIVCWIHSLFFPPSPLCCRSIFVYDHEDRRSVTNGFQGILAADSADSIWNSRFRFPCLIRVRELLPIFKNSTHHPLRKFDTDSEGQSGIIESVISATPRL